VHERPAHVDDAEVLAEVRRGWDDAITRVEHLALGFGAHHWAAYGGAETPLSFVTLDRLGPKRTLPRVEAAYDGAATLAAQGLEFVVATTPSRSGSRTRAFAGGALSCTPWLEGTAGGDLDVTWTVGALDRLHSAEPPAGLPPWQPPVGRDLAEVLSRLTTDTWGPGPYAAPARDAVREHLPDLERWTARYHFLATIARRRSWVATHGEPGPGNQMLTTSGRVLVDWESLKLAPAELDLRVLMEAGAAPHEVGADPEMVELFDLEWRLDEVSQYAARFAAPHTGTSDDEIAFGGLRHELTRPESPG
jgi:spectinomycin phosphotransferase